jgi:uncharacterized membrane-anchored protein YjiN (DUF445 family)
VRQTLPRRQRRLALHILLAAAALAGVAFPFRASWWGGFVLAVAEAGVVGGLADWFAVTALFRRPLGLPIPHTALIPANWELMAARVGSMVGDRVLTTDYVTREIAGVDVADSPRSLGRADHAGRPRSRRQRRCTMGGRTDPAGIGRGARWLAPEPVAG